MVDPIKRIGLALVAVAVSTLACTSLASKPPSVSNIRMTTDDSGETLTESYTPADDFFVFADLEGIETGSLIQARWFAVEAKDVEPNLEINASDYTYETGVDYVYFQLSTADGGDWPPGSYRVELYLGGTKVGEQAFSVQ